MTKLQQIERLLNKFPNGSAFLYTVLKPSESVRKVIRIDNPDSLATFTKRLPFTEHINSSWFATEILWLGIEGVDLEGADLKCPHNSEFQFCWFKIKDT